MLGTIFALSVMVVTLSVIGYGLRHQLATLEEEHLADEKALKLAEVATCYGTARGRPRLIVILRAIAGSLDDELGRVALAELIEEYRSNAPTVTECDRRAREHGLDPKDFPPADRGDGGNGR